MRKVKVIVFVIMAVIAMQVTGYTKSKYPDTTALETEIQILLSNLGYKCTVHITDMDKDGRWDFEILYLYGNENETLGALLATVTAVVGRTVLDTGLKAGAVLIPIKKEGVWIASVENCCTCVRLYDSGASGERITRCILEAWEYYSF